MSDALLDALRRQGALIVDWLRLRSEDEFTRPSALDGWDLRMLTAHVVLVFEGARRGLESPTGETPLAIAEYVSRYAPGADQINATTAGIAEASSGPALARRVAAAVDELPAQLPQVRAVRGGRGPIAPRDWAITRCIESVVHADDLSRSLPDTDPVELDRAALATTTRTLAELLATVAPGRTVEVRVPPFIAVQAVAGPRHTRGTPPNVVETDPLTWVRVAAGRTRFADEMSSGRVSASGQRADLTPYLPLL